MLPNNRLLWRISHIFHHISHTELNLNNKLESFLCACVFSFHLFVLPRYAYICAFKCISVFFTENTNTNTKMKLIFYLNDDNNKHLATIVLCVNFTGQFTPPNWHLSEFISFCISAMSSIFLCTSISVHTANTSQSVCVRLCYIYIYFATDTNVYKYKMQ